MRTWVDAFDRVPVAHVPEASMAPEAKEAGVASAPALPVGTGYVQRIGFSIRVGSWRLWGALAVRRLAR